MAPVTLPPSFYNSFWSADYRTGLEILFKELDKGCKEAEEVAIFIESQAKGHHALSQTLLVPPSSAPPSTSSLQHTLLALKGASSARGEAHRSLALELENRILVGFQQWAERHGERVAEGRKEVLAKGGVVGVWEKEVGRVNSLKATYAAKSRAADDGEDDAKFAPASASSPAPAPAALKSPSISSTDGYTASPSPKSAALRRTGTVADRISEKLRAASITSTNGTSIPLSPGQSMTSPISSRLHKPVLSIDGKMLPPPPTPGGEGAQTPASPGSPREDAFIPPSDPDGRPTMGPALPDKGDGRAVLEVQPPPILLSGLSLSAQGLKDILKRFDAYLLTTPSPTADISAVSTKSNAALASRHRTSMLGTWEKTFSGEEVIEWLRDNVEGFGGDWERCVDAARELTSMGHFSRIGVSVQRGFEAGAETYYILRTNPLTDLSPVSALSAAAMEKMQIGNISSPLSPATSANIQSMLKSYVPARFAASDEPTHVRLRREAQKADEAYKEGVRVVEMKRLEMEEKIERGLRVWERWERERLQVVQQVLKQYEAALSRLPTRLSALQESTTLSVEAYNPDADLKALIEGNRTGPFRPQPHLYESLEIDQPEVNFGIDLRKWAGDVGGWRSAAHVPNREKGAVPEVLVGLLRRVEELGQGADDDQKRKSWIYEVPLPETHALRNSLNNPDIPTDDIVSIVKGFNLPIAAGTVKLWLLELNPPVLGWEGWEDAKAIYPSVGADQERDMTSAVISVLGRLSGIQIYVLDALVGYLRKMIDSTKTEESDEIYVTKLALSLGRCILRPQFETDLTIGDRNPSLFFADLLTLYSAVLPPLVEKKKKDADRVMPVRKRTVLVDQRISRRNISEDDNAQQLLERQMALQHPTPPRESQGLRREKSGEVPQRQSMPVESAPPIIPPPAASAGLGLGFESAPKMADPQDSDDEGEPPFNPNVIPPTPSQNSSGQVPDQQDDGSATADILDGLIEPEEDAPIAGATTERSGLKRATSGDVAAGLGSGSRLRGPRGARGPRPAGGRVPGMSGVEGGAGDDAALGSPTGSVASVWSGSAAGGGLHRSKGSVSAMAARFEKN